MKNICNCHHLHFGISFKDCTVHNHLSHQYGCTIGTSSTSRNYGGGSLQPIVTSMAVS